MFVTMHRVLPLHDCVESDLPSTLGFGPGSIIRCECGQYFVLARERVFGDKCWKKVRPRTAEALMGTV